MFEIRRTHGPMRSEHNRIVSSLLQRTKQPPHRDPKSDTIKTSDFHPKAIAAAKRVWSRRMVSEHHSAMVFSAMLPQLTAISAPIEYQTTALRAALDELHHSELCSEILQALGEKPLLSAPVTTTPIPAHPDASRKEAVYRNVLFTGCLAETVAVAFTAEERERTTHPYIKRVIAQISADEVLHARFGWAYTKEFIEDLGPDEKLRTQNWLRLAFAYLEREELLEVPEFCPKEALRADGMALGVCDNQETRQLFYQVVQTSILPGLNALGFDADAAWKNRSLEVEAT